MEATRPVPLLPTGVVTFLLTDVVESTRLWERAPEEMTRSLQRHDDLIRASVESHGGVLLKSKGEGDSTFSVFALASAAVAAADEAQAVIAQEGWPDIASIRVRMSVHTGESVERNGDYFGRTVNRAARLRAVAEASQVLLSQLTAELVIDSLPSGCSLVDIGVQQLRDLDRPELVYRLDRTDLVQRTDHMAFAHPQAISDDGSAGTGDSQSMPTSTTKTLEIPEFPDRPIPLPGRLLVHDGGYLAGRVAERQRIARQFELASNGSCRVALISGEPGIGKTRLAIEAARAAHAGGATVLLGRFAEDLAVSYQAWIEALTHLVRFVPDSVLSAVGERRLGDLLGLLPELEDRRPGLVRRPSTDPETDRYLLFVAVGTLLEAASVAQPIVLLLDDVHWADAPSLLLLRHVLTSSSRCRLHVLVTFRDAEVESTPHLADFVAATHRLTGAERLSLDGLREADIVDLVGDVAGQSLDAGGIALARALRRETDGNPFFTGEILLHLAESGRLVRAVDLDERTDPIELLDLPRSVRDVVAQRVARLGTNAQKVLRFAAVIGREFELDVLHAVVGGDEGVLIDALEFARVGSIVNEVRGVAGRYSFVHALIQRTMYDGLSATLRRSAHRDIAEALEKFRDDGAKVHVAELALHWMAGARRNDSSHLVVVLREAGDAATTALAPDEAARWYEAALAVVDQQVQVDPLLRTDLLIALGTTHYRYQPRLIEAARFAQSRGDTDGLIRAVLADTRGWRSRFGEVDTERISLVEAALAATEGQDSAIRAQLLKVYARDLTYAGDNARCLRIDSEAVAMARRLGDEKTLLRALIRQFTGFWGPDTLAYRREASIEAERLADQAGDIASSFWVYTDLWYVAVADGDVELMRRSVQRWTHYADELENQPGLDWLIATIRVMQRLMDGQFGEAAGVAQRAYECAEIVGLSRATSLLNRLMSGVAEQRGDEESTIPAFSAHVANGPALDGTRASLVRALVLFGDVDRARVEYEGMANQNFPALWDTYWLLISCNWAEAAVSLDDVHGARVLYDRLAPWHQQIAIMPSAVGCAVSMYLGMLASTLGESVTARAHFEAALATHERVGLPFALARTRVLLARELGNGASADDRTRAVVLLRAAAADAKRFGFGRVLREGEGMLASLSLRSHNPPAG